MAVHLLEPIAPTLHVPRAHPCAAWMDQAARECAATPTRLHRRICQCNHHRDVWLCRTHEAMVSRTRGASCRDCGDLGQWAHVCAVALVAIPEALDLLRSRF